MPRLATLLLFAATLALAACGREPDAEADAPAPAAPVDDAPLAAGDDFERTWLGVLPCADCDGIQTRLQLVRDGDRQTYSLEETYLGADGEAVFTQDGRWVTEEGDPDGPTYRLDPGAPASRLYRLRPDGTLDLLDRRGRPIDTGGQYRLQRL
jgi:copper homeostasis protein (lipoprotein)